MPEHVLMLLMSGILWAMMPVNRLEMHLHCEDCCEPRAASLTHADAACFLNGRLECWAYI